MNATLTHSTAPTVSRKTDVFGFLRSNEGPKPEREERIAIKQCGTPNLIAVTLESPDGRKLSRQVPASRWQEEGYRNALVHNMRLLVA